MTAQWIESLEMLLAIPLYAWMLGVVVIAVVGVAGASCLLWVARALCEPLARPRLSDVEIKRAESGPAGTLAVVTHGVSGRQSIDGLVDLIRSTYPDADCAILSYDSRLVRNTDPFRVANFLEVEINKIVSNGSYSSIILVGHSAGAAILRKMFVWAHGQEDDRPFSAHGRRGWVDRVKRIVMLAGINRGWSLNERPSEMPWAKYLVLKICVYLARGAMASGRAELGRRQWKRALPGSDSAHRRPRRRRVAC